MFKPQNVKCYAFPQNKAQTAAINKSNTFQPKSSQAKQHNYRAHSTNFENLFSDIRMHAAKNCTYMEYCNVYRLENKLSKQKTKTKKLDKTHLKCQFLNFFFLLCTINIF